MMTSSNGNIFRVTGHLCGAFTGHRWIPRTQRPATRSFDILFSLICAWIKGWVNNRKAGDLRRHRTHYDVTVMIYVCTSVESSSVHYICIIATSASPKFRETFTFVIFYYDLNCVCKINIMHEDLPRRKPQLKSGPELMPVFWTVPHFHRLC